MTHSKKSVIHQLKRQLATPVAIALNLTLVFSFILIIAFVAKYLHI